nr:MAG TPA: 4Fe-4S single cluster domain protein [Caudoviricetes sp.]
MSVSFWTQGCPHKCHGCHNQQTWDSEGGAPLPTNIKNEVIQAIGANGIERNFSVLGGEPLCEENIEFVSQLIASVRTVYPNIKIFVWTGYTIEQLRKNSRIAAPLALILDKIDYLIDGLYDESLRDVSRPLVGSTNQRILEKNKNF